MAVYKIADTLDPGYQGTGYAPAPVAGGQVVGLVYVRDVLPDYDEAAGVEALRVAIADPQIIPKARELSALWTPHVGIAVDWRFVAL
jgi:hypothetical protein